MRKNNSHTTGCHTCKECQRNVDVPATTIDVAKFNMVTSARHVKFNQLLKVRFTKQNEEPSTEELTGQK